MRPVQDRSHDRRSEIPIQTKAHVMSTSPRLPLLPNNDCLSVIDSCASMPFSHHHSEGKLPFSRSLLMALFCFVVTACSTTHPSDNILFEDARGAVFLQHPSDRSFRASHPISLEPSLLTRILSGVQIQEHQRTLQTVLAGPSPTIPVFSTEEIRFLAPLLARALATATDNQAVGFSVIARRHGYSPLESSTTETTAGSLYVSGRSLYFALSQYRFAPARTNTENIAHRRLPDTSGLSDRMLLFTPRSAQESDPPHRSASGAETDKVLAVDYRLLQQESPSTVTPVQAVPPSEPASEPPRQAGPVVLPSNNPSTAPQTHEQRDDEVRTLKDLIIKKDLELDALRQELQSVRGQLDDQNTRQNGQKRKHKPPVKLQRTNP